ncbi:M15 family metallopeptidase [Paenibacillus sp. 1P03SA]|uniref:M15 family metallopeptidase n=1 Tax=Paenibacillus sp. 1P03SA TaxID=3132294 RepID=UPI00399F8C88
MSLTLAEVKAKSAPMLVGLHEAVKLAAEQLVERCYRRGVQIRITQGLRTIAEQNALYAQGRTQAQLNAAGLSSVKARPSEPKVTNAKGGTSFHNFGMAIDFVLIKSGYDMRADLDGDGMSDWMEVVEVAKDLGFEWGGDWATFVDNPHFEMTFGLTCAQYKVGKQPSAAAVKAAIARINAGLVKEEEQAMTAAEKQAFAALQEAVSCQSERIQALEAKASMKCPEWAKEAVTAAVTHKLLDSPEGASYDVYRLLTIIHRAGFIKN